MRRKPVRRRSHVRHAAVAAFSVALGCSAAVAEEFQADPLIGSDLPAKPGSHWVWVNDMVFNHMADGKAFLVDGDAGSMLGMLSTGYGFGGVLLPRDRSVIYSPETYFSRGTRGTRTDVVTIYDGRKLSPLESKGRAVEIPIPPKRVSAMPMPSNSALTDDDRFLLLYNFTPGQSTTVVDTQSRTFVGEIDGGGCAMVYPTGPRSYFSLCGDGAVLEVKLDDTGKEAGKTRSAALFDAVKDPVTEKGVRFGNAWLFATFSGDVLPVEMTPQGLRAGARWSLLDEKDRAEKWLPGGLQHLALHAGTSRLYSLMHQGGAYSHKDPGHEVWVYDLTTKRRLQRIKLGDPATSIAITRDDDPLLFAIFMGAPKVDVYDPKSGERLRSIGEIGFTPMTLVTY
jgi:methylamine dehydrogenase heavy chain